MSEPIEVTNLHPDPHCYRQRATWMGLPATQNGDKWRYEKHPDYNSGLWAWWHPNNGDLMLGKVLYARVYSATQAVLDNLVVEDATTLACQDGWIAAQVAENAGKSHSLPLKYGHLVLDEVAVYTPEDWDKVYGLYQRGELTRPWFAGDLLPAEAGGGDLFLSVIHMLLSLWGWRHERPAADYESGPRPARVSRPLPMGRPNRAKCRRSPLVLHRQGQLVHGIMHAERRGGGARGACDRPDRTDRGYGLRDRENLGRGRTARHTERRRVRQGVTDHGDRAYPRAVDQRMHERCDHPRQRAVHARGLGARPRPLPAWRPAISMVRRRLTDYLSTLRAVAPRWVVAA